MAKVVLATGVEQLDKEIAHELNRAGVQLACECHYLEGVLPVCVQMNADTVIISPELPGTTSIGEIIVNIKRSPRNIRVILLPGPEDLADSRDLAFNTFSNAAVHDIVFSSPSSAGSRVDVKSVIDRVISPATFAEAEALMKSSIKMPLAATGRPVVVDEVEQPSKHGGGIPNSFKNVFSRRPGDDDRRGGENDEAEGLNWDPDDEGALSWAPEESGDLSAEKDSNNSESVANDSQGDQWVEEDYPVPTDTPWKGKAFFQSRKEEPEKSNICYMPHQLIAVWSPDGWAKSYTALNLAALAASKGFDTALINYDLFCPELDVWFGVKQTGIGDIDEMSVGVMTFWEGHKPEYVASYLRKRDWGISYLPAGNKVGNICVPDMPTDGLEQLLKIIYQRNPGGKPAVTVVDAGRSYEYAPTMAALRQASLVLIPTDGSPAIAAVTKQQIEDLNRLGYNPRFIEVLFTTPGRKVVHVCHERCSVSFDWLAYSLDRAAMKPQCLTVDGRRAWEGVFNQLTPIGPGSGNIFRNL